MENKELDEDTKEIINSLNPEISLNELGEGKHKITYDGETITEAIKNIKGKHEVIILENDLLGVRVQMLSKSKSMNELRNLAHDSLKFMLDSTPTRIPLGVG